MALRASSGRALLEQSGPCTLELSNGLKYKFDNVADMRSYVGASFKLMYTLFENGTMRAAVVGDAPSPVTDNYLGFGFGPRMTDSKTVVVTTDFTDGYYFTSTAVSDANAGKGLWPLSGTLSGISALGELAGVFTAVDMQPGPQPCIWARGPFTGSKLEDHTHGWGLAGTCSVNLKVSSSMPSEGFSASLLNAEAEASAVAPAVAPVPAPAPSVELGLGAGLLGGSGVTSVELLPTAGTVATSSSLQRKDGGPMLEAVALDILNEAEGGGRRRR